MGQWSQHDEDSCRLPEGMTRVGYDADTERYTYYDREDGSYWEGSEGAKFGQLRRLNTQDIVSFTDLALDQASSTSASTNTAFATDFDGILENIRKDDTGSGTTQPKDLSIAWRHALKFATATSRLMSGARKRGRKVPPMKEIHEDGSSEEEEEKSEYKV